MRAAFMSGLCDSDGIDTDSRGDLVVRLAPGANLMVGGSEVACGLR